MLTNQLDQDIQLLQVRIARQEAIAAAKPAPAKLRKTSSFGGFPSAFDEKEKEKHPEDVEKGD